jgi:hypothetical protein
LEDPIFKYGNDEIQSNAKPWDQLTCISLWEIQRNFRVKIVGAENLRTTTEDTQLYIVAGLYHGGELLAPMMQSQLASWNISPRWYEWVTTNIQMANLPRVSREIFF